MKKNIIAIITGIIISATAVCPVYAAEKTADVSVSASASSASLSSQDISDGTDSDDSIIQSMTMQKSDVNCCQITAKAIVPDRFGQNCFIDIQNKKTGDTYELPMYASNSYEQYCYLPEGSYTVVNTAVFGDILSKYEFESIADFTLTKGSNITLTCKLANYNQIAADIYNKVASTEGSSAAESLADASSIPAEVKDNSISVSSDFTCTHSGNGYGAVGLTGTQTEYHAVIFKIVKSGNLGQATIKYSVDGGNTYSDETKLPISGIVNLSSIGLTATFVDGIQDPAASANSASTGSSETGSAFVAGDTYKFIVSDPNTSVKSTDKSSVTVTAINPDDDVYTLLTKANANIIIKVVRGGSAKYAVIKYTVDGGKTNSGEIYIPESGYIDLPDIGVRLNFASANNYTQGKVIYVTATRKTHTTLFITIFVLFMISIIGFGTWIAVIISKKPKEYDYYIHPYTPISFKAKEKKGKKVNKNGKQ